MVYRFGPDWEYFTHITNVTISSEGLHSLDLSMAIIKSNRAKLAITRHLGLHGLNRNIDPLSDLLQQASDVEELLYTFEIKTYAVPV